MQNKLAPAGTPELIGQYVALSLHWSGDLIVAAFIEALTQANFHSLAADVQKLARAEGLINEA